MKKRNNHRRIFLSALAASSLVTSASIAAPPGGQTPNASLDALLKAKVKHIIVIYQENWSFDSLYGQFPGANGLQNGFDTQPQFDKATGYSSLLYTTPAPFDNGNPKHEDTANFPILNHQLALWNTPNQVQPVALPLMPYDLARYIATDTHTGDIVHRFYTQQLQVDNGVLEPKNGDLDKFVTFSDNPGLVMSYFDATPLPEGQLAQQFTLCDNFFHSAYGGSFLNHQWLIAAATPHWTTAIPAGWQSTYDPATKVLKDNQLTMDGQYAVNTIQPLLAPFSPNTTTAKRLLINNTDPNAAGYMENIGNRLDAAKIEWRWYSGGWNTALSDNVAANNANFQFHHQPFAYYTKYAPFADANGTLNPSTTGPNAHLQDESVFFADIAAGKLPPVSWIKPLGPNNEHPGYADLQQGQQHVADLVNAVKNSKLWRDTVIVVTYDENGGRWDHVAPPVRPDGWGVGSRVPALIISPFSQGGVIDGTEMETASILKLIERRFNLAPLSARDADPNLSDLTQALRFP